jgi:murein DD-endopeptidase MepM/ murein hydrolase activator NlpD
MVEDYGAYNGVSVREHLPVHDVTTGTLQELFGHNAIDIVLDSGTPLYAVTSGIAYRITNWTIPGGPQGYAAVVVSDTLRDDNGDAIAFLYGHVREFDMQNGQHVERQTLPRRSGPALPLRPVRDHPKR